ncbi:hypothetical protein TEHAB4_19660 [Tetragenococcus halophilus]|nr:hypothetical protein TEHAB4_19660 [Tetragenococcus halophilus]
MTLGGDDDTFSRVDSFRKKTLEKCVQNIDVNPKCFHNFIESIILPEPNHFKTLNFLYYLQYKL